MSKPYLHSIFRTNDEDIKQNVNPLVDSNKQTAAFIQRMFSLDDETSKAVTRELVKRNNPQDPAVVYYDRDANLDRHKKVSSLSSYLSDITSQDVIICPSFTTNASKKDHISLHSGYIKINLARRKKAKAESFASLADGDMENYAKMDTIQKAMKTLNNSLSGAYASKSTILGNKASSQHYTLTSTTRAITSLANTISESFIAGSRLYQDFDLVIDHINVIVTEADLSSIKAMMDKYELYYPNSKDCLDMIHRSSDIYWKSEEADNVLMEYLDKITPLERAAFLYLNDLYHLRKHNEKMVRTLFSRFAARDKSIIPFDYAEYLKTIPEEIENVAIHINMDICRGIKLNYKELKDENILNYMASTCKNIITNLDNYKDFLRTFFVTDIMPIDVAHVKDMLRRVAVLSDTDSTCSTTNEWVSWFYHNAPVSESETYTISSIVTFFTSQLVDNNIKLLAANMNIAKEDRELLEMKSEFSWSSFTTTKGMSKTYFACADVREGFVFKEPKLELKGVHLINSSSIFKKEIDDMLVDFMRRISDSKDIDVKEYLVKVANMERSIIEKIKKGDLGLFKMKTLKGSSSYALGPDKSPYVHHQIWKDAFATKYGSLEEPEYLTYALPLKTNKPRLTEDWLANMRDKEMAERIRNVLVKLNKKYLGTFMINSDYAQANALPEELFDAIDLKRVIDSNLKAAYLFLTSIGFYKRDNMLISDMY